MTPQEVADLLASRYDGRPLRTAGGFSVRCPAHHDKSPSLSVDSGTTQPVVLHCHAGCSTAEILSAAGLQTSDIMVEKPSSNGHEIVAEYDYRDEHGTLLFQVVRMSPKTFRQRRPDGTGWNWSLGDTRRVLYHLPELIAADPDAPVYVVEGEKDVEAIERAGGVATCNAGGAGKWRDEYSECLRDRDVVVVADKDDPGIAHAKAVERSCKEIARSVRVVTVLVGKDAADHLAAGEPLSGFTPLEPPEQIGEGSPFVCLVDVEERKIEWLWTRRLPQVGVAVIAGDGGVGKSTMAQKLAAAVTNGTPFPVEHEQRTPRGVVWLSAEEDTGAVIRPRMRLMGADLARVIVLDPEHGASFTLPDGIELLEEQVVQAGAGMVVIDSGPAFMDKGLKVNDENDVRKMLRPLMAMAERNTALVLLLAHMNKGSGTPGQRVMGGSAWRNAPRLVMMVGVPDKQHPSDTNDRIVLVEKTNLGRFPDAVGFQIVPFCDEPDLADIHWTGEVGGVSPADIIQGAVDKEERSAVEEAMAWLSEELSEGPMESKDVFKRANIQKISDATLKRAKSRLGIEPKKVGFGSFGRWEWELPKKLKEEQNPLVYGGVSFLERERGKVPANAKDAKGLIPEGLREVEQLSEHLSESLWEEQVGEWEEDQQNDEF